MGFVDLYEISEPEGFDTANFVVKQNPERYARDIIFGNDTADLVFYHGNKELGTTEQLQDISGRTSFYLDNGLNWILETVRRFGFEGKIEYILKKEGIEFTTGLLDLANPDTDGASYFGCTVIQNNEISDYKKHEDTTINLFSDKNVRNETITPIETVSFLRKAVPISLISAMRCPAIFDMNLRATSDFGEHTNYYYYNNALNTVTSGIGDTLTLTKDWISHDFSTTVDDIAEIFTIAQAKRQLKDFKLDFTNFIFNQSTTTSGGGNGYSDTQLVIRWGVDINLPMGEYIPFISFLTEGQSYTNPSPNFSFTIPFLPIDAKVWVFMKTKTRQSASPPFGGTAKLNAYTSVSQYNLDISASSFALDTIVKGVRYIDTMRQCSKFVNALPIDAPRFSAGGEFYDQLCYNRSMISQNITKPFNTTFKDILGSAMEVHADYEIQTDTIAQLQFPDYYKNTEIGIFKTIPSKDYKESWNERFKINTFKFGYQTYEQNRLTENTTRDIHTESEWLIPNSSAFNSKEVDNYLIRSALSQQVAVDLEISKPQTADENDDKVYIVDIIALPLGSFKEFAAELQLVFANGKLTILNKKSTANADNVVINWAVLGVTVGGSFQITQGRNSGTYTTDSITPTNLVLSPVSFTPDFSGDAFITMKFYYTGVLYQTRTKEGFDVIDGDSDRSNYPNLKYTIRKNMVHWESFLNTSLHFNQDKIIRNSYFKNDPDLTTQFNAGIIYIEKASILVSGLKERILTPKIFDLTAVATFNEIMILLFLLKTERGFIRCYNIEGKVIKGYIQELNYVWKTNELTLKLEEKYESEILLLNYEHGQLTVNDLIYNLNGNVNWWQMNNEYFTAFDANSIPICNVHRFDKVQLNGVIYGSEYELVQALKSL